MDSVYTKIGVLTMHLKRNDMFDVANYPTASFVSKQIISTGQLDSYLVTGDFNIHGVTRSVTFPARISMSPNAVKFDAAFTIRQKEFGMTESASKTNDEVPLTVSIYAARN